MNRNNGGRAAGNKNHQAPEAANDKSVKVKYISSPVMMEAKNPSQFKQIVQHYTGQSPNETAYNIYANRTTNPAATTTTAANTSYATTTEAEATECDRFFANYGSTNMNVQQDGIDGYSWEEIAKWNRNQ